MTLLADLEAEIGKIVRSAWSTRNGTVVPGDNSVTLGNDGVEIDATVLYADLADSTDMVNYYKSQFSAEVYKAFLHCCAKIIRSEGGEITAYDGDRIMAVYIGDSKNTSAVRTSMKIAWAVRNIVQSAFNGFYTSTPFELKHVCGIDTSKLFVAKTGVRGANDLVWVGRAANYAAKLSAMPSSHSKYITEAIYSNMNDSVKFSNGTNMWEACGDLKGTKIYRSTWWWQTLG
ncbi:adenylate/guanylate cyclase domain-containing protein [Paraburkholderia sp. J8-2]|uniref:adenylate/guanylate cyclase domain-containing protein n=1 Tax=Paraburkholderia sp. J8-2 TaxID=2805440 RepID=UPI002AB62DA2|nr:adenylate/guanylate cyclase domain-containing protein [Paraburkholderia sp. J8-2]